MGRQCLTRMQSPRVANRNISRDILVGGYGATDTVFLCTSFSFLRTRPVMVSDPCGFAPFCSILYTREWVNIKI